MRATAPVEDGVLERDGFGVGYAMYGAGDVTVCLVMPDTIVHAGAWKAQVAVPGPTLPGGDGRPAGQRTLRPADRFGADDAQHLLDDVWAVLDHVGAEQRGDGRGLRRRGTLHHPGRRAARPGVGRLRHQPGAGADAAVAARLQFDFDAELDTDEGWARSNRHYWLRDWPGFAEFFFTQMFPEPHSSKQVEDTVGWALETTPETMLIDHDGEPDPRFSTDAEDVCRALRCPVLVVSGSLDMCQDPDRGRRVAELTGGDFVLLEGCGHLPLARDPVKINLLLRDFVRRVSRATV